MLFVEGCVKIRAWVGVGRENQENYSGIRVHAVCISINERRCAALLVLEHHTTVTATARETENNPAPYTMLVCH